MLSVVLGSERVLKTVTYIFVIYKVNASVDLLSLAVYFDMFLSAEFLYGPEF